MTPPPGPPRRGMCPDGPRPTVGGWTHSAARASALVAPPRGILATGPGGAARPAGGWLLPCPPTGENRRALPLVPVTAPGLRAGLSGVILDAEGMDQRSSDGLPLPEAIGAAGLLTGVRAKDGRHPPPGTRGETITEGLDGVPHGWRGGPGAARRSRPGGPYCGSGRGPRRRWRSGQRAGPGRYVAACQAAGRSSR